jgi:uracil-DNA glycosylase
MGYDEMLGQDHLCQALLQPRAKFRNLNIMAPSSSEHGPDFAEGPADAKVMLVGQNPGKEEVG